MTTPPGVLVVEDNPLTSKMLRITLESEGYAAIQAFVGKLLQTVRRAYRRARSF